MNYNYAIFILSNNRANTMKTHETLIKNGYTGEWFVVIDSLDAQKEGYTERLGQNRVLVFDKEESSKYVDSMTNSGKLNSVVFARNAVYDIAKSNGYEHFIVLDDDLTNILLRYPDEYGYRLLSREVENFDFFFNKLLDFANKTKAYSVSLGMQGDFIGGINGNFNKGHKRRSFCFFVLNTERRMEFKGLANEDLNASLLTGVQGGLVFAFLQAQIITKDTLQEGGMTESYNEDVMKYVQHFSTVMLAPSSNKIKMKPEKATLFTSWKHSVPLILNSKWKKGAL